jgi:hypothetical protein
MPPISTGTCVGFYTGAYTIHWDPEDNSSKYIYDLGTETEGWLTLAKSEVDKLINFQILSSPPPKKNRNSNGTYNVHFAIDGEKVGNYTRYLNSALGNENNLTSCVCWSKKLAMPVISIITSKPLREQDQLLLDYGSRYWESAGITPLPLGPRSHLS